jgi:prophage antirepressor-like protein
MENGEPWFVLKDACEIISLGSPHKVAERLDEDERKQIPLIDNLGRLQATTIVSEAGLYKVILRSDKPEADQLMRFVTHEVLPSIRKTGSYIKAPQTYIQALEALIETEREKERLSLRNADLQIELDKSKEYYTIKRVASMNGISWKSFDWRALKNTSRAMEREVRKIFDANYEKVNAYHVAVWRHEYPELRYC